MVILVMPRGLLLLFERQWSRWWPAPENRSNAHPDVR
jgi:hypothetical protein